MTQKIVRLPSVMEVTGLSRSTIYKMISEQRFPTSVRLGQRSVGWLETDIAEWVESRITSSRGGK